MPRRLPPLLLLLLSLAGCAFVTPRFPQNVQVDFAREDMRKLTTRTLELYYPARLRPSALRIAARLEDCVERLRSLPRKPGSQERVLVYLTGADFNNAYVNPDYSSIPQQMVMPAHMSLELFNLLGFGPSELGEVGCHESVHYVQLEQTHGIWWLVNTITGGLFQPNSLTESWFLEGLATYYEGRLGKSQGRPHSPLWRGFFESASQSLDGHFHPGYLSPQHRRMDPLGGNYLTGSYFIQWLVERYGEERLWKLVEVQGGTIIPPIALTLRFSNVYGRTIGSLFEEFTWSLTRNQQQRVRPATQQVLAPNVGYFARLAASPDGALATVDAGRERVPHLTVRERDGSVRFSHSLTQFLPGRRWISTFPTVMSGLSFTADGSFLFLMAADIDSLGSYLSRVWQVNARTGEIIKTWEGLEGMGGSVTPDGQAYVFVHVEGDTANLHRLELATGARVPLTRFEGHSSLGPPSVAADGRVVFPQMTEQGWNLALLETDGTVRALTQDAHFNYSPRWVDANRIVFQREHEDRWQAHVLDLTGGEPVRITDAPHLVMDVAPAGNAEVVFLNRDNFDFSLDRAPIAPVAPAEALAQAPSPAPEPAEATSKASAPYQGHTLDILTDKPYSPMERFFLPELRAPYFYALPDPDNGNRPIFYGGLALAGQDRLGFHQYALLAQMDSQLKDPSVSFSYATALTAPWYTSLTVARLVQDGRRDLQASLSTSREFWTTPVSFNLLALRRDYYATDTRPAARTMLLGPEASISYFAGESTSYGGTQRGVGLSLGAGVYPLAFDNANPFADLRAEATAFLPGLPLLLRDNLQLTAIARFLPNAPEGLLQVGGIQAGTALTFREGPEDSRSLPLRLQPGISFSEYLRGYEDYALSARSVLLAQARYRYRVIIDYGWTSFFWLLPSFFISQVELEAFASWARTDLRDNHRAVGGALYLRTTFGQAVPLSLFYQYARRFDDGLGDLHLVGFAL
ncbi:TolB family protein [Archangium violaceum]|uniref:TolB family protein n=1 Tax=Archangium violaceum TaxID=83451 RepID=UPI0036DBA985